MTITITMISNHHIRHHRHNSSHLNPHNLRHHNPHNSSHNLRSLRRRHNPHNLRNNSSRRHRNKEIEEIGETWVIKMVKTVITEDKVKD